MRKLLLSTIAAGALGVTPLLAQDDAELFAKLDANKDGVVTADEVDGEAKRKIERLLRTSDKDGDKKLSKEEFAAGLKEPETPRQPLGQAGQDRPDPRVVFGRMDANKDGKIGKEEAVGPTKENFDRLDSNGDGSLSEEEFARFAGRRPEPREIEAMFDRTDANSDGKLTKDEMPERIREPFGRALERLGGDSMNKEQFARFMAFMAQQGRPDEPGRPGQPPPGGFRPPLIATLDADSDGELSASEIEAASKALLKLDKNSDGKLTRDELFPPPSEGRPGEPRPGEPRPGDGRPGQGRFNAEEFRTRLKEADKNEDGKLSKDEAPPMLKDRFDRIDANSDGQLDETELKQMLERMRERGGDRPQGRRPEGGRPKGDRPDNPKREQP